MISSHQLILEFPHRTALGREDFLVASSNAKAVALIDRWPDWPDAILVLTGPEAAGKTHLAQVWRAVSGANLCSAVDLQSAEPPDLMADNALVVEDISGAAQSGKLHEPSLFHLINFARESGGHVLLTGAGAPAHWPVKLPDLRSRLVAAPLVEIEPPDETLLAAVLAKLFADRQLAIDGNLIAYLTARMERSFGAARTIVGALDRAALTQQRKVTPALARRVLAEMGGET